MFFPEKYNISFHILHDYCGCDFLLPFLVEWFSSSPCKERACEEHEGKAGIIPGTSCLHLPENNKPALCKKETGSENCSAGPSSFSFALQFCCKMQNAKIRAAGGGRCLTGFSSFPCKRRPRLYSAPAKIHQPLHSCNCLRKAGEVSALPPARL